MPHAVPTFVWVLTVAVLVAVIVFDLVVIARRKREVTTSDALIWIGVYVGLAVLFAVGLFLFAGPATGSHVHSRCMTLTCGGIVGSWRLRERKNPRNLGISGVLAGGTGGI